MCLPIQSITNGRHIQSVQLIWPIQYIQYVWPIQYNQYFWPFQSIWHIWHIQSIQSFWPIQLIFFSFSGIFTLFSLFGPLTLFGQFSLFSLIILLSLFRLLSLFNNKKANYPLLMKKGRGSLNVDKQQRWGGGGGRWIKKNLNVNFINFNKMDKPKGGGSEKVEMLALLDVVLAILCIFSNI